MVMYSYDQPDLSENQQQLLRKKAALEHLVDKHITSLHKASSKLKGDTPIGDIINSPHANAIKAIENTVDELYQTKSKLNAHPTFSEKSLDDFDACLRRSFNYFEDNHKFPHIMKAAQALKNNDPEAAVEAIWDDIKFESMWL